MDCYLAANKQDGEMLWGELNADDELPASLFLHVKPEFVVRWPLYGPGSDVKSNKKKR